MMAMEHGAEVEKGTPQWMRDLKLRKKCKNLEKQLSSGDEPNLTPVPSGSSAGTSLVSAAEAGGPCNDPNAKMVQERSFTGVQPITKISNGKTSDEESEDLQYGPGIVSKLKNRYLSLTLREVQAKNRPTILPLRKASSLEHLLEEDEPDNQKTSENKYKLRANGVSNPVVTRRFRSPKMPEMKRARSVEAISQSILLDEHEETTAKSKRISCHENMLIFTKKEGSDTAWKCDKSVENTNSRLPHRVNKPLMIPRVMNEREKPPADVVKQAVKIFEPAKSRTRPPVPTGEVAAKVGLFNKSQNAKKPPIKQKPATLTLDSKHGKSADNW